MNTASNHVTLAIPKGRIAEELVPVLKRAGIEPEAAFFSDSERGLHFATNTPDLSIIRVRSFDVATFVAFGAAQIGVAGSDVLAEFEYEGLYAPMDLGIGHCRLSLAAPNGVEGTALSRASHVRIATKYPHITTRYFAARGIQAECIKLSGAMELAPTLGLAPYIVDLVSSGRTLKAHHLHEVEQMMQVSSRLIVNRTAFKTRIDQLQPLINQLREAAHGATA